MEFIEEVREEGKSCEARFRAWFEPWMSVSSSHYARGRWKTYRLAVRDVTASSIEGFPLADIDSRLLLFRPYDSIDHTSFSWDGQSDGDTVVLQRLD